MELRCRAGTGWNSQQRKFTLQACLLMQQAKQIQLAGHHEQLQTAMQVWDAKMHV